MLDEITLNDRLSFYKIDSACQNTLKKHHAELMKILPNILDAFYKFMTSHPASLDKFQTSSLDTLKQAQFNHWKNLFSGVLTDEYAEKSAMIGKIHHKLGITPFLYIGGYSFILNQITRQLIGRYGKSAGDLVAAINSVALMDMELALTVYAETGNQAEATATANNFANRIMDLNIELSMAVNEAAIENTSMLEAIEAASAQAQSVAAAVEELATGITSITHNSNEIAKAAEQAHIQAQKGKEVIDQASNNMHRVSESVHAASERVQSLAGKSEKIVSMVAIIEKIASQTNLLALNATIEAARAGSAGKGFAVVAGEVKALANQTAQATVDIRETISSLTADIEGIVNAMQGGAGAVADCEASMHETIRAIDMISAAVTITSQRMIEIANILTEQEMVSTEVSGNVNVITSSSQQNVDAIAHSIETTENVSRLIAEQISTMQKFDIPKKTIRIAKSDQIAWKKHLSDMIAGRIDIDPEDLSNHHNCRLGKWYYSDEGRALSHLPAYRNLETAHKVIHEHGINAAKALKNGDKDKAIELLRAVDEASVEVIQCLDELIEAA